MIDKILAQLQSSINSFNIDIDFEQTGQVISAADGIVKIQGLRSAKCNQVLLIDDSVKALVVELDEAYVSAVLLEDKDVSEGATVVSTGQILQIPAGDDILGRVVDPFGAPLDDKGEIRYQEKMPLEADAPKVLDRKAVSQPCPTGIKIIDAFIPIGKGQREMIIGDRLTGKTSIALDMIINQKGQKDVVCIYVAIGQRASKIAKVKRILEEQGAMEYTTIVASTSSDLAIMQVQAPFAGCAIGEYFRDRGKHAIVIYDDLSKHAVAYRQISLLLRRPPGREAYPGDIFYLHSRLLERAAKLNDELGGGSLTAIPIIETQEGNFATYVPTNVWSITDGQIVLKSELFLAGQKPAIDIGMSVSRVGSAAQAPAIKSAIELKLLLAQYQEYKNFARYGADVDKTTQALIDTGDSLVIALQQRSLQPRSMAEQAVLFQACLLSKLSGLTAKQIGYYEELISTMLKTDYMQLASTIEKTGKIDADSSEQIEKLLDSILEQVKSTKVG